MYKRAKVQKAFKSSFSKKRNIFTKVNMQFDAAVLLGYFSEYLYEIENCFTIITPLGERIIDLKDDLVDPRSKEVERDTMRAG